MVLVVERLNLGRAVKDLPRGDDLVAGMVEGGDRRLAIVAILCLHVLPHDRLATLANGWSGIGRYGCLSTRIGARVAPLAPTDNRCCGFAWSRQSCNARGCG